MTTNILVKKKNILQPHTPSYESVNAATRSGPTMPATAPMELPIEFNADEKLGATSL